MGIYDFFEKYLPEMKNVRAQYELYLKKNELSKTAEEKLFDYLALISNSYTYNKEKMMTEFSYPNIPENLKADNYHCINNVILPLSERARYHQMEDRAEFSTYINNELYETKENIDVIGQHAWTYKRFPAHETAYLNSSDMVRYALNIKPKIGLFKKLDELCLKYDAFDYKVINPQIYNQRTDPVIIYAQKHNQQQMIEDLEKLIKPYRRKDEYETIGYTNLGNGIYIADEVKKEQMQQLKHSLLTPEEKEIFLFPVADEYEQDDREFDLIKKITHDKSAPVKAALFNWINKHQYDYAVSNAQYQIVKGIIEVYKKTQENTLIRDNTKQICH